MAKFYQGIFKPKNPKKFVGNNYPTYRSGWELQMFVWLDTHPSVINWSSECIAIPYVNPVTGKNANYYPDLLITYVDKGGAQHTELIEIKPLKETLLEKTKTRKDKLSYLVNQAKWKSAQSFCKHNGIVFRVLTESDLFFRK